MRFQCAALVLVLILPTTLLAQDDPELQAAPIQFNMSQELTLRYVVETRIESSMSLPEGDQESKATQTQSSVVRVTFTHFNEQLGWAAATFTTESLRVSTSMPDGSENVIDSNDPDAVARNPDAALMLATIDVPIEFVMESNGTIQAANGHTARQRVLEKLGDRELGANVRQMIGVALADQSLKESIALVLGTLPGRVTTVGEAWSTRFSLPAPALGQLDFLVESMLSKLEHQGNERIAQIDSRFHVIDRPPAGGSQGRILDPAEQKGTGVALVDTTRGLLLSSKSEITLNLELTTLDEAQREQTARSVIGLNREVRLLPLDR